MTRAIRDEPTKIIPRSEPRIALGRPRFRLRLERGGPRRELVSAEERVLVGRSPEAGLVVENDSVSRIHCEIVHEDDGFLLRDLGSANGTWMGGIRVREAFLPSETRIGVGEAELSFTVASGTEEIRLHPEGCFGRLLGETRVMRELFARLERVAARDTTLLLEGESGTGKELAARAVHEASARRDGPFVVVDCSAIPRTLMESELFGHERGAYTGASQARAGAFVRANGGTIFLDEVGELDIDLQPRLLRALEQRETKPIGAPEPLPFDARIIAATNRDLRRMANRGDFREDLYYRLAVACVRLPSLRERTADVPLLVRCFLEQHSRQDGIDYSLDEEILKRLMLRPWPGNVRELRNVVEQIIAFGIEEVSLVESPEPPGTVDAPFKTAKARIVERFERDYLVAVLASHGGNITAAASAAELDRVHFLRLLDRYGLRKTARREH
jgi:two-component system response regulator GlrR